MNGAERIAAERQRQIDAEGWVPEHDDLHSEGELAQAGAWYALGDFWRHVYRDCADLWPWPDDDFKPVSRIRELEKAGALIAAEIDRLLRVGQGKAPEQRVTVHGARELTGLSIESLRGHSSYDRSTDTVAFAPARSGRGKETR